MKQEQAKKIDQYKRWAEIISGLRAELDVMSSVGVPNVHMLGRYLDESQSSVEQLAGKVVLYPSQEDTVTGK